MFLYKKACFIAVVTCWLQQSCGMNPLHDAVLRGDTDRLFNVLLEEQIDVNERYEKKWTALHCAVCKGYELCTRMLLARGACANVHNDQGHTPLHIPDTLLSSCLIVVKTLPCHSIPLRYWDHI